jgi:hypothetical protein
MKELIIEEIEDDILLQEMSNLSEEEKEIMSFEDAKILLGWS